MLDTVDAVYVVNYSPSSPNLPTAVTSGKRRLDFDDGSRALKNKTFFLDLPGHKNIDQLERELTMRGGKVCVCVCVCV